MNARGLTGALGALAEAWEELRIHRLRVLLSLVGVAVAVAAMTFVLAMGQMLNQASSEFMEQMMGRQVTLNVQAYRTDGSADDSAAIATYRQAAQRFDLTHTSVVSTQVPDVRGVTGTLSGTVSLTLVDPEWGTMHRRHVTDGRWLEAGDLSRRAPALVVNERFLLDTGLPPLDQHPTVEIPGDPGFTAIVVGVVPDDAGEFTTPQAWALYDSWVAALSSGGAKSGGAQSGASPDMAMMGMGTMFEAWVPPEMDLEGQEALRTFVAGELGEGWQVDVFSNSSQGFEDLTGVFSAVVLGVGSLVLALGTLSLVNISLVTVKYRVREIGIRRSFGATSGRIFFGIMLESVVATALAGVAGVVLAIMAMRLVPFAQLTGMPVQDVPPFPMSMAFVGLAAATIAGAFAGLLPAIYAVRIKPVDAIRI